MRALKGARTFVVVCERHSRLRCAMPRCVFRWRVMLAIAPNRMVDDSMTGALAERIQVMCVLSPSLPLSLSPSSIDFSLLPCLPVLGRCPFPREIPISMISRLKWVSPFKGRYPFRGENGYHLSKGDAQKGPGPPL